MSVDTSKLVFDRTEDDAYNADDLNRVSQFCVDLVDEAIERDAELAEMREEYNVDETEYTSLPYDVEPLEGVKTDFQIDETYSANDLGGYIDTVIYTVDHVPPADYRPLPETMRFLAADGANNIEYDLKGGYDALDDNTEERMMNIQNIAALFQYSGEIYAGGIL